MTSQAVWRISNQLLKHYCRVEWPRTNSCERWPDKYLMTTNAWFSPELICYECTVINYQLLHQIPFSVFPALDEPHTNNGKITGCYANIWCLPTSVFFQVSGTANNTHLILNGNGLWSVSHAGWLFSANCSHGNVLSLRLRSLSLSKWL